MEFAYLDESGDNGAKGSKNVVVCLVCTNEKKKFNKAIRKAKQALLRKKKTTDWLNRKGEIKFYSFPDKELLIKTLKELVKIDFKVYFICFKKNGKSFNKNLKERIIGNLFLHIFERSDKKKPQKVISDLDFFGKKPSYFSLISYNKRNMELLGSDGKKTDSWQSEIEFTNLPLQEYEEKKKEVGNILIKIEPKNSRHSEELQAVDLICGSIFQALENNNSIYFNIIKEKILAHELYEEK